jgi:hypothetical protein
MRKFRGKKRYYRNLARESDNFRLALGGPNDWYDFWHEHFDWKGRGNQSGRERNEHLSALFNAYKNVLEQLKTYQSPHQVWLSISKLDSSQDGLCFHTPNPNSENFPYLYDDFVWGENPILLVPFMKEEFEVGVAQFEGETWYAVRVRGKA